MHVCMYVRVCVKKAGIKEVTRLMFHFVSRSRPTFTKCATQTLFVASLSWTESTSKRDNARQRSGA